MFQAGQGVAPVSYTHLDVYKRQIWNRRKSGELYIEMLTISAVQDAHGETHQYVALFSDISVQKTHQQELEHLAHFDELTSLPNRVLLADRLRQAIAQSQRRGQQLAVAYLDLDGFKDINDRHGHETGNQFLITAANRMKQVLREGDTLARLGGDEFVAILLDLADIEASESVLNRLLTAVALPMQVGDHSLQISASLGLTFYPQAVSYTHLDVYKRQSDRPPATRTGARHAGHRTDDRRKIHHAGWSGY